VRFDAGSRAAYSTDASNFRQIPIGVVVPLDVDDMTATVAVCCEHGAPITNRGGGTSLSGETTNVAVIVDSSKYVHRIEELDPDDGYAWCEPGVINDALREAAAPHGLTFGPDPSTHDRCTIGGNVGNNSCGVHSVMAGRTSDNTLALEILTYDGVRMTVESSYAEDEIERVVAGGGRRGQIFADLRGLRDAHAERIRARFPAIPRRVSGYNLDELLPERGFNLAAALVGSEGTCVTVLRAKLRLVPWPAHRVLVVVGYPSIFEAADDVPALLEHRPMALEAMDQRLVAHMRARAANAAALSGLPHGSDFLMLEFGGDSAAQAEADARRAGDRLARRLGGSHVCTFASPAAATALWKLREAAVGNTSHVAGQAPAWPGWEDSAVHPARLGPYLRELWSLYQRFGYTAAAIYGHFGDGCVHSRIPFDFRTQSGLDRYRAFLDEAADLVVSYGGSLSGEHGDGQQRSQFLEKMFGPELVGAMLDFKRAWDPEDRMNPGKLVDPVRLFRSDENLRIRLDPPPGTPTYFSFAEDGGSFESALTRCVGIGKCRALEGGVMCPSYQVLREEEHSTRGRARLLFEMLQGEAVEGGWRSGEVFDALDLCLSCKGCKSDCPTGVDMATYKAEFLAHHYRRRLRPRSAYAMGLVMYAARLGGRTPRVANLALHGTGVSRALRWAAGVHPDRHLPSFAPTTFRRWFSRRPPANPAGPPVVLFPDTFTNHFDVGVARAACEVLEAAGFDVRLPARVACCGRPLFDYGMLDTARRLFTHTLDVLAEEIDEGIPVVVPEPSCAVSFRDELPELLPRDRRSARLAASTFTFSEFLAARAPDLPLSPLESPVLVQPHCHQRSVVGTGADEEVYERLGAGYSEAPPGCCGLAGSWGFERAKFDASMRVGERVLFPAVRAASPDTLVVADGFSCRTQIAQGSGRRALHLAQVVRRQLPA